MKNKTVTAIVSAIAMLAIIFDPQTALQGASEGISLCLQAVIPSLFPLLMLSMLLCGAVGSLSTPLLCNIATKCGVPRESSSLLIPAFLGGYPVGAQAVSQAYRDGVIGKYEAKRLLMFCSNAGPSFIFGMVALQFNNKWVGWLLWLIQMIPPFIIGSLTAFGSAAGKSIRVEPINIHRALRRSIHVMATICGWIVLFRVILSFADRWFLFFLPKEAQAIISGILELSIGAIGLRAIENPGMRFIIASAMLSFGGLCVLMQTASVTGELGIRDYLKGKLIQVFCSLILSFAAQQFLFCKDDRFTLPAQIQVIGTVILVAGAIFLRENRKNSSIPVKNGV